MMALQVSLFLQQLHKFVSSNQGTNTIPWMISGDFNMRPYYPGYELISNGKVSDEGLDKLNPYKYKYPEITKQDVVRFNKEFWN